MGLWGWGRYVPVAERRAKARREMDTLRNKGKDIQPLNLDGRTIARSFWGKGWCDHLESFSDYANRLPRGRTYVRNGSVANFQRETMYVCVFNRDGEIMFHRNMPATPETFLKAIAPYRQDLVVAVECRFTWYWLADLCV
jgi:hypothetical protein